MAISYNAETQVKISLGARWLTKTEVTLDTEYVTEGYELSAEKLGLPDGLVSVVWCEGFPIAATKGTSAYGAKVIGTAPPKLQLYTQNKAEGEALKEAASKANVSACKVRVFAIGQ